MSWKTISSTVKATHDSTVIEGLLDVSEDYSEVTKTRRGDGAPEEYDHVASEISLTITFSNDEAAQAFITAGEANLVIRKRLFGGGLIDKTYKNVKSRSHNKTAPVLQENAVGQVRIQARARYGADDTYATMITSAPVT